MIEEQNIFFSVKKNFKHKIEEIWNNEKFNEIKEFINDSLQGEMTQRLPKVTIQTDYSLVTAQRPLGVLRVIFHV